MRSLQEIENKIISNSHDIHLLGAEIKSLETESYEENGYEDKEDFDFDIQQLKNELQELIYMNSSLEIIKDNYSDLDILDGLSNDAIFYSILWDGMGKY
jgi:vacuolar-type H+-ATPase subunit I/STV1